MDALIRFKEWIVEPADTIIVLGTARRLRTVDQKNGNLNSVFIIENSEENDFIIGDANRTRFQKSLGSQGWQKTIAGVVCFGGGIVCLFYLIWRVLISKWLGF